MAALDREVAEGKAEALEAELADAKELVETLKIEVEVLKEENAVFDDSSAVGEEYSKMAFIQMEKRSERLAAAFPLRPLASPARRCGFAGPCCQIEA
jgi:dynactin 1